MMSSSASPQEPRVTAAVVPGASGVRAGREVGGHATAMLGSRFGTLVVASPVATGSRAVLGARFATEAAKRWLSDATPTWGESAEDPEYVRARLTEGFLVIARAWAGTVREYERALTGNHAGSEESILLRAYDATLTFGVCHIDHFVAVAGVGESRLVVVSSDPEASKAERAETSPREPASTSTLGVAAAVLGGERHTHAWSDSLPLVAGVSAVVTLIGWSVTPSVLAVSLPGTLHVIAGGIPCQDSSLAKALNGGALLCVADGHGDRKYTRSDYGARFAVQTAREAITEHLRHLVESTTDRAKPREKHLRQLRQAIIAGWYGRVRAHAALGTDSSQSTAQPRAELAEREPYGSTLVAAFASGTDIMCVRLGDGDVLVVDTNGQVERVFSSPGKGYSNATLSLASTPSEEHSIQDLVEVKPLGCRPRLLLVCSDGVSDPYIEADSRAAAEGKVGALEQKWGLGVVQQIEAKGWEGWSRELPETLARLSALGSGDDVSVAAAYWPPVRATAFDEWVMDQLNELRADWLRWAQDLPRRLFTLGLAMGDLRELSFAFLELPGAPGEAAPNAKETNAS